MGFPRNPQKVKLFAGGSTATRIVENKQFRRGLPKIQEPLVGEPYSFVTFCWVGVFSVSFICFCVCVVCYFFMREGFDVFPALVSVLHANLDSMASGNVLIQVIHVAWRGQGKCSSFYSKDSLGIDSIFVLLRGYLGTCLPS